MRPLRVGYVVKRFPRASETFIAQEILELERRGVEVSVLTLRPNDHPAPHGWLGRLRAEVHLCHEVSVSEAWKQLRAWSETRPARRAGIRRALLSAFDHPERSGRRYLAEATAVASRAEELELDHLHAHFANHPAFVAMLAHRISGRPYSFTAHAKDIFAAGPPPELWRSQVGSSAFTVTVSEANRSYLASLVGPSCRGKLRLLHNGVDVGWIRPSPPDPAAPRRAVRALFVGRLIEKKGADLLLEAAARLVSEGARIRFTLVGDGPLAEPLRGRIRELGLSRQVELTSGLPHEEVIARMAAADLFVLPCRVAADGDRDALPTVLLEAMACGLPCISAPVNGIPEIIEDGETGLLVPENDPGALAEALRALAADPLSRWRMGRAGRRRAEETFALQTNVGVLLGWIEEAVAECRGATSGGGAEISEAVR